MTKVKIDYVRKPNPKQAHNLSRANTIAHQIYGYFIGYSDAKKDDSLQVSWGQSMAMAWAIRRTKKALRAGKCRFCYLNTKGEERQAFGTLDSSLYPSFEEKGGKAKSKKAPYLVGYWDIDRQGWRSFDIRKIKGVITIQTT